MRGESKNARAIGRSRVRNRKSIRLKGYDYSRSGAYFITICTRNRQCLFGQIIDGEMVLNKYGKIVADEWIKTPKIRDEIALDKWIVMPNHFHGVVWITHCGRGDRPVAPTAGPRPRSLGALVAGFKSAVTKRINEIRHAPGMKLWQRNYYEHIVRNENELRRIREYIVNNPIKWTFDNNNPDRIQNNTVAEPQTQYGRESWMV